MDLHARGYKLFYEALQKQIEKQFPAFKGIEKHLFEALDLIDSGRLKKNSYVYSGSGFGVMFFVANSDNKDIRNDTLKIKFSKGAHLKSFKKLPNYKKNNDIIFEFNVFADFIKYAEHSYNKTKISDRFLYSSISYYLRNNLQQAFDFRVGPTPFDESFLYNHLLYRKFFRYGFTSTKRRSFDNKNQENWFNRTFKDFSNETFHKKNYKEKKFYVKNDKIEEWINEHINNAGKQEAERERKNTGNNKRQQRQWQDNTFKFNKDEAIKKDKKRKNNNYYKLLKIPTNASVKEIKRAYRQKMQKDHPDVSNHPNANKHATILNKALEILSDPVKRSIYNSKKGIDVKVDFNDRARGV